MNFRIATIAAVMIAGVPMVTQAKQLQPLQSQKIDLGAVAGDAYYTVGPRGYDVVATFAQRDGTATPVRVEALLKPGQTVIFSTPGSVGNASQTVELARRADTVEVHKAAIAR